MRLIIVKKKRSYEKEISNIKDELEKKLTNEEIDKIEAILKDCEELVRDELELETKLKEKFHLIEEHKQTAWQIANLETSRIIEVEEEVHQQQLNSFAEQRANSIIERIARLEGQVMALAHSPSRVTNISNSITNSGSMNFNNTSDSYNTKLIDDNSTNTTTNDNRVDNSQQIYQAQEQVAPRYN